MRTKHQQRSSNTRVRRRNSNSDPQTPEIYRDPQGSHALINNEERNSFFEWVHATRSADQSVEQAGRKPTNSGGKKPVAVYIQDAANDGPQFQS